MFFLNRQREGILRLWTFSRGPSRHPHISDRVGPTGVVLVMMIQGQGDGHPPEVPAHPGGLKERRRGREAVGEEKESRG